VSTADGRDEIASAVVVEADKALLDRLAGGELEALEELYDRYKSLAYGIALRITRDEGTAEDVVQEAFLGVWRNAARFDPGRASVKTWLLSVVHHRAVDALRRRRPATELPAAEEAPGTLSVPDVWGEVAARLDAQEVRAALATLPQAQREAVELAYLDGLTQTEIAVKTDAPLGTVKGRLRLGLSALRRALVEGTLEADGAGGKRWVS